MLPAHEVKDYIEKHSKRSDNHRMNTKERGNLLSLIGGLIKILGYDRTALNEKQSNERIQDHILDKLQELNYYIDELKNIRKKTIPEALEEIEERKDRQQE